VGWDVSLARDGADRLGRCAVARNDQADGGEGDDADAEWSEESLAARTASVTDHGRIYSTAESGPLTAAADGRLDP
jgi:hypothetical protein